MNKLFAVFAALICGGVFAATPIAVFTGETLKDGTVNGITLSLNGNTAAGGVITIGNNPVLIDGVTDCSAASVVVKYTGAITASEFAIVSARSSGYVDVVGVSATSATKLQGIWANNNWTGVVVDDTTLPSAEGVKHSFCFTYGDTLGTTLMIDGNTKYSAGTLKGGGHTPIGFAIGGARNAVKGAAAGMQIESILVLSGAMPLAQYNAYLSYPTTETTATISENTTKTSLYEYGAFLETLDFTSANNKLSLTDVPALGGVTIRVQGAAELPAGAYTLIEWTGLMGQANKGYGHPILDLCGVDATNFRLIPMVGKVVLLKTDPAQMTKKPYKIWCVGDSITEGYNSSGNCANYRVQLATKLACAGYNVQFVGQYTHRSKYASGEWAPDEWAWHSGVSGQRMWTRGSVGPNRLAGYVEAIDAAMYQVPNTDVICFLLGTNDFGAGDSGGVVFNGWKIIVKKLLDRYPNAKIVVSPCIDMHDAGKNNRGAVFKTKMEAALAGTDDTFTAEERARLVNAKLDTYVTGSGAPYFEDVYHPTWDGHSKMSDGWYDAIVNNSLVSKTVEPTEDIDRSSDKRGAEANVDETYLEGFTKVRTLAIPEEVAYELNATPAYTEDAEAPANIGKVAYYMELVRKDSGEVRYVWADMDAFGDSLDAMLVPTGANVQKKVSNLHVASNMGSITPVAANVRGVEGYLEFSPYTASPAAVSGAPTALWSAMDWNDTLGTSGNGRGSMQISRIKSEGYNAAELLFAWNNWGAANTGVDGTKAGEIGIGDFPQHYMADHSAGNGVASLINAKYPGSGVGLNDTFVSSDYTTTRFSPWGDTMNAKAYSVRTLEVWVKEGEIVTDPVAKIGDEPFATLESALQSIAEGETTTVTLVKACSETVTVPANVTVVSTSMAQFSGSISGSGRIVCEGYAPATNGTLATSLRNAAWTGTLELKNVSQTDFRYDLQLLANTGSTICFNGYTNYPCAPSNSNNVGRDVVAGAWEIGEGGVTFTGGFSNFGFNYVGALKGSGKIKSTITGTAGRNYVRFEGDASGFTGAIEFSSDSTYRIALTTAETPDSAFTSSAAKAVYVAEGVTTSISGLTGATLVGSGTLVYANNMLPPAAICTEVKKNTWTGTVALVNKTDGEKIDFAQYGNEGSTVRLNGVTGWFPNNSGAFQPTLELVDPEGGVAYKCSAFSSSFSYTFRKLTGSGTFEYTGTNIAGGNNNKNGAYTFNDVSEFTGSLKTTATGAGFWLGTGSDTTHGSDMKGKLVVSSETTCAIAASTTWTAPSGVFIIGALDVNGTLENEVAGSGHLGYTKFNKVHANVKTGLKKAAWTGTLVITGDGAINDGTVNNHYTTLNEYGSIASKIELAGNCSGYFGLSTLSGSEATPTVVQPELVVSGTWSQNSGYSQANNSLNYSTIFRKVSGTGTMSSPSSKPNQLYYIEDASEFTGTLEAIAGKFVIGSRVDNTLITNGSITVKAGETIPAGLTWKASAGITLAGTVDFASTPSAGDTAIANGVNNGTVTLGATAAYTVGGVADTTLGLKIDGSKIVLVGPALPEWVDETSEDEVAAYNTWAEANGVTDPTTAKQAAFAFNCANDDEAIAAEEEAFVITSITIVDGVATVTVKTTNTAGETFNITPVIKGSTTVNGEYKLPVTDSTARFFKGFIEL